MLRENGVSSRSTNQLILCSVLAKQDFRWSCIRMLWIAIRTVGIHSESINTEFDALTSHDRSAQNVHELSVLSELRACCTCFCKGTEQAPATCQHTHLCRIAEQQMDNSQVVHEYESWKIGDQPQIVHKHIIPHHWARSKTSSTNIMHSFCSPISSLFSLSWSKKVALGISQERANFFSYGLNWGAVDRISLRKCFWAGRKDWIRLFLLGTPAICRPKSVTNSWRRLATSFIGYCDGSRGSCRSASRVA